MSTSTTAEGLIVRQSGVAWLLHALFAPGTTQSARLHGDRVIVQSSARMDSVALSLPVAAPLAVRAQAMGRFVPSAVLSTLVAGRPESNPAIAQAALPRHRERGRRGRDGEAQAGKLV